MPCPYMVKTFLEIFFPGSNGPIFMKLCMKHQKPKPIIFCSNNDPGLTLTYFTARSNFKTMALIWDNVTMMESLEIIASCELKFG